MTTTTVACAAPITAFTALGVTVTQAGNDVPTAILDLFEEIAADAGVTLTVGGVAENLGPAPLILYNPGTGAPAAGTWKHSTLCVDSAATWFLCTVDGSPGTWVQTSGGSGLTAVDNGDGTVTLS